MTHTPNGEREAAEWLNMLAAQLERPSRCGMYRNIPGLSAGQVYDIAQDMRSAIALLQSPAAPVVDSSVAAPSVARVREVLALASKRLGEAHSREKAKYPRLHLSTAQQACDELEAALRSEPQSPAAVQQGEAVEFVADICGNCGTSFDTPHFPCPNTPSPASPEVGPNTDDMNDAVALAIERGELDGDNGSPEVGGLVDAYIEISDSEYGRGFSMSDWPLPVGRYRLAAALAPSRQAGGEAVAFSMVEGDDAHVSNSGASIAIDFPPRPDCRQFSLFVGRDGLVGWAVYIDRDRKATGKTLLDPALIEWMALYTHPAPSAESADAILDIVGRHVDRETYSAIVRERYDRLAAAPTATDEGRAL